MRNTQSSHSSQGESSQCFAGLLLSGYSISYLFTYNIMRTHIMKKYFPDCNQPVKVHLFSTFLRQQAGKRLELSGKPFQSWSLSSAFSFSSLCLANLNCSTTQCELLNAEQRVCLPPLGGQAPSLRPQAHILRGPGDNTDMYSWLCSWESQNPGS